MGTEWRQISPDGALVDLCGTATRSISGQVIHARLDIPRMGPRENDAWSDKLAGDSPWAGEVSSLGAFDAALAPGGTMNAVKEWVRCLGICAEGANELAYACRGAPFHHDAESFPDRGFCVLWLADDTPWDLVFPYLGMRVPLEYGTAVVFDAAQPHGVVARGRSEFKFVSFEDAPLGVFASLDFKLNAKSRRVLGVRKLSRRGVTGKAILRSGVTSEDLDEETGHWHVRSLDKT